LEHESIKFYIENNKKIFDAEKKFDKDEIEFDFSDKSSIYNSIDDGISILDTNLNVLSVNFTLRSWYPNRKSFVDKKCYYVYHRRQKPCECCPILKTLSDGNAHYDIVPYYIKSKDVIKWHELQSYPINKENEIVGVVEYVKDITREVELNLKVANIERSLADFKVQNEILKDYLEEIKSTKSSISKNMTANINKFVKPLMQQIKSNSSEKPADYQLACLLETILENITKPYLEESDELKDFTSQELQIISMIKGGRTSKEIADILSLSIKTIDFHRAHIRRKLNIERTDNLRAYLMKTFVSLESL
jgi:DNA-binding CsgD family transcriptional regulator